MQATVFPRPLLQSAKLTVVVTDENLRVAMVRGGAVQAGSRGRPLVEALPFLQGFETALADVATGRRGALDLPRVDPSRLCPEIAGYVSLHACRTQDRPGVIIMIQDVSDKAETELSRLQQRNDLEMLRLRLEEATAEAQAANRAKSTFLAHVSHELKTPLAVITGNADILCGINLVDVDATERKELDAEIRAYAQDIRASGEFLARMIGDLLDMVRAESGRFAMTESRFDLTELALASLGSLKNLPAAKGIELAIDDRVPEVVILGDPTRLRQVLINLLTNAIAASRPGMAICLDWTIEDDGGLTARVVDQGSGLPRELRNRLFDPFVTGGRGSGLGLNISAMLVDMHGGKIGIDPSPAGGSIAWFTLPPERVKRE